MMNAANRVAHGVNDMFADQTAKNQAASLAIRQINADNFRTAMLGRLGSLLAGGGAGGGGMGGFQQFHANGQPTGMFAAPGAVGTNITANALPRGVIDSALTGIRTSAGSVPGGGVPAADSSGALAQQMSDIGAAQGSLNAMNFDRSVTPQNANMGLAAQQARAQQGANLSRLMLGINNLDTGDRLRMMNRLAGLARMVA
jgi:hypothetical protein